MTESRRRAAFFFGCDVSLQTEDEAGYMVSPGGADPRLFIRAGCEIAELLGFESSVFTLERPREHEHHHLSDAITYGVRISIRHKQSGMLLALLPSQPSTVDGNCHTLTLVADVDATQNSHFRFVPRYKIHSEGDYVCHGDELLVQLFDRQLYFHTSEAGVPVTELTLRSSIVDDNTVEVNGSDTPSAWTIRRYDFGADDPEFFRETERVGRSPVFSGAPVVLVHREKEAHLISSVTKPKVSLNRARLGRAMTRSRHRNQSTTVPEFLGTTMTGLRSGRGTLPHPLFFPADAQLGSDPSFRELSCSCSALWIFEGPVPTEGGPLRLGEPYRVRQAATNLYLCVIPRHQRFPQQQPQQLLHRRSPQLSLRSHSAQNPSRSRESAPLADDGGDGGGDDAEGELVRDGETGIAEIAMTPADFQLSLVPAPETEEELHGTLFVIRSVFSSDLQFVTEQEFVRLQHFQTGLWVRTEVAEHATGGANVTTTEHERRHGIRLVLEVKPATHDALLMGHVKAEMQRNVLFLFHNGEFLRRYREAFAEASAIGPERFRLEGHSVVIRCAAEALSCLIRFCSDSDDANPLTREGLPICEHQRMMFDLQFHRIIFDVLVAPFVEGDRTTHLPSLPFTGGVLDIARLLEPQYVHIHMVCRLCYRLLRQMIRGTPSLSAFLVDYIPFMYYQDGLKLHVADTMMEIFTGNGAMPGATYASAVDHYVNLLKSKSRSSGYIRFLGTMCRIDNKTPIPENQALVCKRLLAENPQTMLKVTMLDDGGVGVVWKKTEPPTPVLSFLLHHPDAKLVKFFESQIHLFNTLALGADPSLAAVVEAFMPSLQLTAMAQKLLLSETEGAVSLRLDGIRASVFELAINLYIARDLRDPEVLLRANTILLGGSSLRHGHDYVSGRNDTELMKTIKQSALQFLRDNPFQVIDLMVRNGLLTTTIDVWTVFVTHWQYTEEEEAAIFPLLLRLLNGVNDKYSTKKSWADTNEAPWNRYARSEENLIAMRTKQSACQLITRLLDNAVHRAANAILQFTYVTMRSSGIGAACGSAATTMSNSDIVATITEFIDAACAEVEARFQPSTLVPLLVDVARYNSVCLSDAAMDLLVSLANVRRSVAKKVLSVDMCPTEATIKTFDELSTVAAELELAVGADAEDLDDAISMLLKTLEGKPNEMFDDSMVASPSQTFGASGGGPAGTPQSTTLSLTGTMNTVVLGSDQRQDTQTTRSGASCADTSPLALGAPEGVSAVPLHRPKRDSLASASTTGSNASASSTTSRGGSMWGNARAVVKVMAFSRKVQMKRKQGGLEPETSADMLHRAVMMRHWGVHKTLIRALKAMTLDHIAFGPIMEFFYYFSMVPSNAIELARHVTLFVQGIPHPTAHNHCMHVVISIISSGSAAANGATGAVDKGLLSRLVAMIVREKSQRTPDASFVRLVNRSVIGTNMLPANQRFLLSLLHSQQVFSSISDVSPRWSSAQLVFNTALVMLLCNCCANNPGSRHMAQRIIPAPSVFAILNVRSRKEELPLAHQAPYYRLLAVVFFTLDEESPQERARLKQSWMKNEAWWDLVGNKVIPHLRSIATNVAESAAMRTDDIVMYREFTFLALMSALITYFRDCFVVSYAARNDHIIDRMVDLSDALIDLGDILMDSRAVDLREEEWSQLQQCCAIVSAHVTDLEITAVAAGFQRVTAGLSIKLMSNTSFGDGGGTHGSSATESPIASVNDHLRAMEVDAFSNMRLDDERSVEQRVTAAYFVRMLQAGGPEMDAFIEKTLVHMKQADFVVYTCGGLLRAFTSCLTNCPPESLEEMQTHLDKLGMMKVVTSLTQANDPGIIHAALALGIALLEGGNRAVQDNMLHYFNSTDEHFFRDIREMISVGVMNARARHLSRIQERCASRSGLPLATFLGGGGGGGAAGFLSGGAAGSPKSSPLSPTAPPPPIYAPGANAVAGRALAFAGGEEVVESMFSNVREVFRMLQLMCEGHHLGMQNYIRVQSDNLHSINIVFEVTSLMKELCSNIDRPILPIVQQGFALLTEFCQGPCEENQIALINGNVCALICQALDCTFGAGASGAANEELASLKQVASTTLLALLEGRSEGSTISRIVSQVSPSAVAQHAVELSSALGDPQSAADDDEKLDTLFNLIIYLKQVLPHTPRDRRNEVLELLHNELGHLQHLLGCIEIQRGDQLENVYFRIPFICTSLTHQSKDKLLWSVDRSTRTSKLADFFHQSDELIFEMETAHHFQLNLHHCTRFRLPATGERGEGGGGDDAGVEDDRRSSTSSESARPTAMRRGLRFAKGAASATLGVTLLHPVKRVWNSHLAPVVVSERIEWYEAWWLALSVMLNIMFVTIDRRGSDQTTAQLFISILGIVQLLLCLTLLGIDSLVYLPVYLYSVAKRRERAQRSLASAIIGSRAAAHLGDAQTVVGSPLRASSATEAITLALGAAPSLQLLHALRVSPRVRQVVEVLLLCSHRFSTVFRTAMVLVSVAALCISPYFFAVHLLGLVNKSSVLRNVIVAITQNGKSLVLTMALGMVMVYMFSIVGLEYFPDAFSPDGTSEGEENCSSLARCFIFILIYGLRQGGGIGDVMDRERWESPSHTGRLLYDFLFFALLNIVFLNILFGIIIDTFAELRDEKRKKEEDMHSCCFICGVDSDTFDKEGGGFEKHVKEEHNMWQYLYFFHHLRRKDPNDFTGQESFVAALVKRQDLSFFPQGTARVLIQQATAAGGGGGGGASAVGAAAAVAGGGGGSLARRIDDSPAAAPSIGGGGGAGASSDLPSAVRDAVGELRAAIADVEQVVKRARHTSTLGDGATSATAAAAVAGAAGGIPMGGGGGSGGGGVPGQQRARQLTLRSVGVAVQAMVAAGGTAAGNEAGRPPLARTRMRDRPAAPPPLQQPGSPTTPSTAPPAATAGAVAAATSDHPMPPQVSPSPHDPDAVAELAGLRGELEEARAALDSAQKDSRKLQQDLYVARQQAKAAQDEVQQMSEELRLLMEEHEEEVRQLVASYEGARKEIGLSRPAAAAEAHGSSVAEAHSGTLAPSEQPTEAETEAEAEPPQLVLSPTALGAQRAPAEPVSPHTPLRARSAAAQRRRLSLSPQRVDVALDPVEELMTPLLAPPPAPLRDARAEKGAGEEEEEEEDSSDASAALARAAVAVAEIDASGAVHGHATAVHLAILHRTARDALVARDEWRSAAVYAADELDKTTEELLALRHECALLREADRRSQEYMQTKLTSAIEQTIVEIIAAREGREAGGVDDSAGS